MSSKKSPESILNLEIIFLIIILGLSLFINLYKINTLMMFIGDMGRDYLAALDMIKTGVLPLVGIQSSVVWLHQGPLSIYFIALSFFLSNLNPFAPAVLYSLFGVVTTFLVYKLGKTFFNTEVGLLSALFFATSPLIIVNIRMPYHSSPIPLFSALFFLILYKYFKGDKRLIFFVFLFFGLLLQLELANLILISIVFILYFIYKPKIDRKQVFQAVSGLLLGVLPFIIYDTTHKFVQTLGLPLWALNRIRVFLGAAISSATSNSGVHEANSFYRSYQQLVSAVFPFSKLVSITTILITGAIITVRLRKDKSLGFVIMILWFIIPMFSYFIHRAPGTAYFPVLFPVISLMVGYAIYQISIKYKVIVLLFVIGCMVNLYIVINNNYFLITKEKDSSIPPESYSIGPAYSIQEEAVDLILKDANGEKMLIKGGGFIGTLETGVDNFIYIAKYKRANISDNPRIVYTIYNGADPEIPIKAKTILNDRFFAITRDEN